jgi:small subunit ribosomal protein S20
MANIASAEKRARQTTKRRARNMSLRSKLRTAIKQTREAIGAGDKAKAAEAFRATMGTIDAVASKNIIHANKAARHKSRLAQAVKAMG